jgi:hypothetical protein
VEGIGGVLAAYRQALPNIRLSGPTLFVPVLSAAVSRAQQAAHARAQGQPLTYTILLIITDGEWRSCPAAPCRKVMSWRRHMLLRLRDCT